MNWCLSFQWGGRAIEFRFWRVQVILPPNDLYGIYISKESAW